MSRNGSLHGITVLVTRPGGQAAGLVAGLKAEGATIVEIPTIRIEPLAVEWRDGCATVVAGADWAVFVSPNAVAHGIDLLPRAAGGEGRKPRLAAVGPGTARALTDRGWRVAAAPRSGGGAAALLAENAFCAGAGDRVVIVRGAGGRETLAEALGARGARVEYVEVYRREPAPLDPGVLRAGWHDGRVAVTIVTSETGLLHLLDGLAEGDLARLLGQSRLVTVSARIAAIARHRGFRHVPVVADGADDTDLIEAVRRATAHAKGRQDER